MRLISSSPFQASQLCCFLLIPSLVVSPLAAQSSAVAPAVIAPAQGSGAVDNTDLQLRVVEGSAPEAKVNSTLKGLTVAVTNATGAPIADAAVAFRLPDNGATGTFPDGSHAAVAYTDTSGRANFTGLHWNQTPGSVAMRVTATKGTSHAALLLNKTLTSDVTTVVQVPQAAAPSTPPPPAQQSVVQQPVLKQSAVQQPGQTASAQPVSRTGAAPVVITPVPPAPTSTAKPEPTVSVTGASPDSSPHSSKTKWIILAAVAAAAAGGGFAVMGKGKSTAASTGNALTIGKPSVSVGSGH